MNEKHTKQVYINFQLAFAGRLCIYDEGNYNETVYCTLAQN